jgi:hypothetical protein
MTMTALAESSSLVLDEYVVACCSRVALYGLRFFLSTVTLVALYNSKQLFFSWHGWTHRLCGALHLFWLGVGACLIHVRAVNNNIDDGDAPIFFLSTRSYDLVLGLFGIQATITAARAFPHKYVSNAAGQSGTLHRKAIVTQAEMIEHAFYQFLNLWQAIYLHILADLEGDNNNNNNNIPPPVFGMIMRLALLWLVSAPWLIRHRLPVHSFSRNWKLAKPTSDGTEIVLYRIKKTQYLFYKHVILHGVNISLAVASSSSSSNKSSGTSIPHSPSWRVFWLALNTSYVMEFFLQTMVKRKVLDQHQMLWLQRGLMAVSSLAAVVVLQHVSVGICVVSLLLNFVNRHHDVLNTTMIGVAAVAVNHYLMHGGII